MSAGRWAAPGTQYGPCADDCEHLDCAETRRDAAAPCRYCNQPIGYDTRFYALPGTLADGSRRYAHAACEEDA